MPGTSSARPSPAAAPTSGEASAETVRQSLAARYLAIATPANRRLDHDFDRLEDLDHSDLAAARADLRDIAATERLFDHQLLGIPFPPPIGPVARSLVRVNQARAALTTAAAGSASLARLRSCEPRLDAANGPVEEAVRVIRAQLDLPPPDTS
jgi:hypothetical protein